MGRAYKWQFHFNAMHNTTPETEAGKHAHSFLVILWMEIVELNGDKQNRCEGKLKNYLKQYTGKYLNELENFKEKIPTVEVICETLYYDMEKIAEEHGMDLLQIEVGDSPTARYILGKRCLLGDTYHWVSDEEFARYKKQVESECRKAVV